MFKIHNICLNRIHNWFTFIWCCFFFPFLVCFFSISNFCVFFFSFLFLFLMHDFAVSQGLLPLDWILAKFSINRMLNRFSIILFYFFLVRCVSFKSIINYFLFKSIVVFVVVHFFVVVQNFKFNKFIGRKSFVAVEMRT